MALIPGMKFDCDVQVVEWGKGNPNPHLRETLILPTVTYVALPKKVNDDDTKESHLYVL